MIKVNNVSKSYKMYNKPIDRMKEALSISRKQYHHDFWALKDISFEVNPGETFGIIGTNGSGKSTLLKMITGVLTPTEGKIEINGRISALLELGAGFNMEYTGIENIYLNGTMMGYTKEEMDDRVKSILDFADIGEFVYQPVKTYSSGMFARLAFAVAINVEPDILIVDEALSVGDMYFQNKCYKKFTEFKEKGKTILFVTHDLGSVIKYCDRAMLINSGDLISIGSPIEIVDKFKKLLANQLHTKETDNENEKIIVESSWKKKLVINESKQEYGNKKAEIIDFAIVDNRDQISNTILKEKNFEIKMKVKFNENVKEPIFAFTIRNIKGTDITGTNTALERITLEQVEKDKILEISFEQTMTLQGGEYLLCLGCTGFVGSEFEVYHRLYDVTNISVIADKNSVGYYDMNSNITIN